MAANAKEFVAELRSGLSGEVNAALTDADVCRFLRARQNDIHKATDMINKWWDWWNTPMANGVPPKHILDTTVDPDEELYTQHAPHALQGLDKHGRPIYWERTGLISNTYHHIKRVKTVDDLLVRHVRLQELMLVRAYHSGLARNETIEKIVVINDFKDQCYTPDFSAITYCRRLLQLDQQFYPERLANIVMINAPWFFSTLYALVSPFIDPITAAKIKIVGSDYLPVLRELIDDDQIPKELGGSADVTWHYPYVDASCTSQEHIKEYLLQRDAHVAEEETND